MKIVTLKIFEPWDLGDMVVTGTIVQTNDEIMPTRLILKIPPLCFKGYLYNHLLVWHAKAKDEMVFHLSKNGLAEVRGIGVLDDKVKASNPFLAEQEWRGGLAISGRLTYDQQT